MSAVVMLIFYMKMKTGNMIEPYMDANVAVLITWFGQATNTADNVVLSVQEKLLVIFPLTIVVKHVNHREKGRETQLSTRSSRILVRIGVGTD